MNIPFELIFVVLFFVLPALSGVLRRRGGKQPPTGKSARPTRPARPDASATTSTTPASRSETAPANTDVPRWLEEAQRRVREAQQSETDQRGRRGGRTASPTRTQPARPSSPQPSLQRPQPSQPARMTSLEDYRPKPVSLERTTPPGMSPVARQAPAATPPPRVQRTSPAKSATLGSYRMQFDNPTLMTGFVWHQILSPPLSKSRRTRLSRRQP